MSLIQAETIRFESCAYALWLLLNPPDSIGNEDFYVHDNVYGILYSEIPFQTKYDNEKIGISYYVKKRISDAEVHILTVDSKGFIEDGLKPYLSESIACLLSFVFRKRLAGSRHWGILEDGKITIWDLFLRLSLPTFKAKQLSSSRFEEGIEKLNTLYKILKEISEEDFYRILRSLRLYHLALLTFPIDVGLSYSLLTSSIDNFSSKFVKKNDLNVNLTKYASERGWEKIFKKYSVNETLKNEIIKKITRSDPMSKRKFIHFIEENLSSSFYDSFDSIAWEEDLSEEKYSDFNYKISLLGHYKKMYKNHGNQIIDMLSDLFNEDILYKIKLYFEDKYILNEDEKREIEHMLKWFFIYNPFFSKRISKKELNDVLNNIYNMVRSSFYHHGKSPPKGSLEPYETLPFPFKLRVEKLDTLKFKGRKITFIPDVPSWHLFERIVHESIYNFLISNFYCISRTCK